MEEMSLKQLQSHTYVVLPVSRHTFTEIRGKLEAAGYSTRFVNGSVVDMHGVALEMADVGVACKVCGSTKPLLHGPEGGLSWMEKCRDCETEFVNHPGQPLQVVNR